MGSRSAAVRSFGTNLSNNSPLPPRRPTKSALKQQSRIGKKTPLVPLKSISEIEEGSAQENHWEQRTGNNAQEFDSSTEKAAPLSIDFCKRWSTAQRQVHVLEERLEDEIQKAAASAQDHLAAVARLEALVTVVESDRDGALRKLERERSSSSALAADLAKARRDASEERQRSLEWARDQSNTVAELEEQARDHSNVVAKLKGRVTIAESDLAKAKEDAEEEKVIFGLHDTSRVEQVRSLEKRLEEEKRKSAEATRNQSIVVAQLKESVANAESGREEVLVKSNELEDRVAKLENENKSLLAALGASQSEQDHLESRLEQVTDRCNNAESDLERVTSEKEKICSEFLDVKAKYKDTATNLEAKTEEAHTLKAQVSTFEEARLASFEKENNDQAEVKRLTRKLEEVQDEASQSLAMCVGLTQELESLKGLKRQLQSANETITSAAAEQTTLMERIKELESEGASHRAGNDEDKAMLKSLEAERYKLVGNIQTLELKVSEAIRSAVAEQTTLKERIKELESEQASHRGGNVEDKAMIESLKSERYKLVGNIQTLELEVSEAESQLQYMSATVEETQSHWQQLECQVKDLRGSLGLSEQRLKSERESFQRNERMFNDQIEYLKVQAAASGGWDSYYRARVETLVSDVAEKQNSLTTLTGRMEQSRHEFEARLERKDAEMIALRLGQDALEEQLADVMGQLGDAEATRSKLLSELKVVSERLEVSEKDAAENRALCADLKFKLEMSQTLLDESDAEMQKLREILFRGELEPGVE